MAEITASLVKELREQTGVGMMECKKALVETGGDKDAAVKILRERGVAIAGKRAARAANQGIIDSCIAEDGTSAVMIEVNCETDFVARNESFQAFVKDLVIKAKDVSDNELADAQKDALVEKIAEIGENLVIRRNAKFDLQGTGMLATYIHMGGKVGVLLELSCEKDDTVASPVFKELAKDITLHIAAANPAYLNSSEVPEDVIKAEREIYAKQVEGKPANIIDKIVDGKLNKYFSQICLVEQEFVKDTNLTITQLIEEKAKELGDTIAIRRFVRYQLGA